MSNDEAEMKQEWAQMEKFIDDNINSPRLYIKSGLLEPMHLQQKERDILVNGMTETMNKCINEIEISEQIFKEKTKKRSKVLAA